MSSFRTPVGPQPSKVYWRRRLVVLLGLLAVIVIVILIVVRPGSGAPTPSPSPSGSQSAAPSGTSTNSADAEECDPSKVTLDPITDSASYDPGVNPTLSFTLKSTMTVPCTLSAGSDVQEFRITSGTELIWTSKDCQEPGIAATIVLKPGVPFPGSSLAWDRTRSSVDSCGTERPQVTAEGASYHLGVIVGDLTGSTTKQFLLY